MALSLKLSNLIQQNSIYRSLINQDRNPNERWNLLRSFWGRNTTSSLGVKFSNLHNHIWPISIFTATLQNTLTVRINHRMF